MDLASLELFYKYYSRSLIESTITFTISRSIPLPSILNRKWLGAAPKPRYAVAVPEETPIQAEIRSLLKRAEMAGDTVKDLVLVCLTQFRQDCFAALDFYSVGMMEEMSSGQPDGLEDLAIERDERLDQARETLKLKLERLLKTAEEKPL
jgi:hypothetical protein